MSKFFFYVTCLQMTFATVALAEKSHAQSLEEVQVSCHWQRSSLEHVFANIQQQTDFSFLYDYEAIKEISISQANGKINLAELLKYVSSKTGLAFQIAKDLILVKHEHTDKNVIPADLRNPITIELPDNYDQLMASISDAKVIYEIGFAEINEDQIVRGTITSTDGEPLIGAAVVVKETGQGTVTDNEGNFTIAVPDEGAATLVVSYIGYRTTEVQVSGGQTQLNIQLAVAASELDEVVVIGYGTASRAKVTGSIAKLGEEDIRDQPITSFDQAIVGRVPGVDIALVNGAPGGPLGISIRGASSITGGNSPLIVIDGVPVSSAAGDNFSQGRASLRQFNVAYNINPLTAINPSDVESIEVLKDAAATAIYGSRGSNGVILITTKKGSKGERPVVSLNAYGGIQQVTKTLDLMNGQEFAEYSYLTRGLAHVNRDPTNNTIDDPQEDRIVSFKVAPHHLATLDGTNSVDTDWQDAVFQDAAIQNYELSVRGGTDKLSYYFSGGYLDQEGIILNSGLKRYTARLNVQADLSDKIRLGLNFNPSFSDHNIAQSESNFWREGLVITTLMMHPNLPIYNPDGSLLLDAQFQVNRNGQSFIADIVNPVALANFVENTLDHTRLLGNAFAEVDVFNGLSFRTSFGLDMNFMDRFFYRPRFLPYRSEPTSPPTTIFNYAWSNQSRIYNWLTENYFTYDNTFGSHNLNFLLGFSAQEESNQREYLEGNIFPNDNVTTINAAQNTSGFSEERKASILSYLGRVIYDFDAKYLFSASLRRDGSSRFGRNTKWGWFPSVSAGWRISNESFFPDNGFLTDLKIRGSWGITGNTDIPFFGGSALLATTNYVIDGGVVNGLSATTSPNPNLSWEQTTTTDIGIDLELFNGKLNVIADYYVSNTEDLLLNVTLPATSGFTTSLQNIGELENRGFELQLSTNQKFGDLRWSGAVNFSTNQNEIKALAQGQQRILFGGVDGQGLNANYFVLEVGEELGSFLGYKVNGVFENEGQLNSIPTLKGANQAVGDLIYADTDGDGDVDEDDRTVIGSNNPDFIWGFNTTFEYKGFDLSFNIQGKQGFEIFNSTYRYLSETWGNNLDVWRTGFEGIGTPRPVWGVGNNTHVRPSELHIGDGSFIRVRNITFGYTLPNSLVDKIYLQNLRIYFSALNPFTFDDYIGFNPEVSNNFGDAIRAGEDFGNYPLYKSFTFGVNVNF